MSASAKPQVIIKIKRKAGHGGGHHGGAWKVAYADFITCMFALFMVLWLLTQADLQLRQDIARYFRNSSVLPGGSLIGSSTQAAKTDKSHPLDASLSVVQGKGEDLEALRGHAKEIQRALEQNPGLAAIRDNVRMQVTEEGLEIQVIDSGAEGRKDLLFDINSAGLKPALVTLLGEIASELGKLPNRIEIGGHTDARPFAPGAQQSNWDLSYARANAARQIMEGRGLYPHQVLRVTAYADTKLLNPDDPLADENRRLSVLARRDQPTHAAKTTGAATGGAITGGAAPGAAPAAERLPPPFVVPGVPPIG
jgi:chemotaxis protein MotB